MHFVAQCRRDFRWFLFQRPSEREGEVCCPVSQGWVAWVLDDGVDISRAKLTRRSRELGAYSFGGAHSDFVFFGDDFTGSDFGASALAAGVSLDFAEEPEAVSLFDSVFVPSVGAGAGDSGFDFGNDAASRSAFLPSFP
jgi:hypothetical protein